MHLLADLTLKDEFTPNWNSVTIVPMMESLGFGLWRHRTRDTDSPSLLQFAANAVLLKKLHSFPSAYVWEDNYRLVTLGWTVPLKGRVGSGLDSEVSLGNESVLTLSFRNSSGWGLTVETFATPKRCHYWGVKMTRNFFFFFFLHLQLEVWRALFCAWTSKHYSG